MIIKAFNKAGMTHTATPDNEDDAKFDPSKYDTKFKFPQLSEIPDEDEEMDDDPENNDVLVSAGLLFFKTKQNNKTTYKKKKEKNSVKKINKFIVFLGN